MDDEIARELINELKRILDDAGFGWVVAQVEESAAEGEYVVKQSSRSRESFEELRVERASDARRGEIGTRPLTPVERLELLIDAAATALAQIPALEDEVQDVLLDADPEVTAIEFVDEDSLTVSRSLRRGAPRDPRRDQAEYAIGALNRLRGRVSHQT